MPVIVPSVAAPTAADILGSEALHNRAPRITEIFEEPLQLRMRAIRATQGATQYLEIIMLDDRGNPISLETVGLSDSSSESVSSSSESVDAAATIRVRFREATLRRKEIYQAAAQVIDASAGQVKALIPSQVMAAAGVYLAEFGIFDTDDELRFTNTVFLYVERSAWVLDGPKGPPGLMQLKLSYRDSDPQENELTDAVDYDLAEVCQAAIRTVEHWNDAPPDIAACRYTTINFPFPELWKKGIRTFLYEMATEFYRRNRLPFQAGGTSIDDRNRDQQYNQAFQQSWQEFQDLLKNTKARLNISRGFRSLGSGYSRGWLSGRWH